MKSNDERLKANAKSEENINSIRTAIQSVGNYEENVRVWTDADDKTISNYKIDDKIPEAISDKLSEAIEQEAKALNLTVLQHI